MKLAEDDDLPGVGGGNVGAHPPFEPRRIERILDTKKAIAQRYMRVWTMAFDASGESL
ncbi:MAG TPA: hypothetical protein VJZ71_05575 [Phycisphaerae bacterium]|nr:hypothetical protein [Phycisphaerae bacterium]